jgi:hypothetical protein
LALSWHAIKGDRKLKFKKMADSIKYIFRAVKAQHIEMELGKQISREGGDSLHKYHRKMYSQHGEDGIISEIFKRIEIKSKNGIFCEIGLEDGTECNTLSLALNGWSGVWIEADESHSKRIRNKFKVFLDLDILTLHNKFACEGNMSELIPENCNFLSIDIDGLDHKLLNSIIKSKCPDVICVEYNAAFGPDIKWKQSTQLGGNSQVSSRWGASLASLDEIATNKGYILVACDISGTNAFFVKREYSGKFHRCGDRNILFRGVNYHFCEYVQPKDALDDLSAFDLEGRE